MIISPIAWCFYYSVRDMSLRAASVTATGNAISFMTGGSWFQKPFMSLLIGRIYSPSDW